MGIRLDRIRFLGCCSVRVFRGWKVSAGGLRLGGPISGRIGFTHRPLSSSFLGLPYRILNINHKTELLRGLWVESVCIEIEGQSVVLSVEVLQSTRESLDDLEFRV